MPKRRSRRRGKRGPNPKPRSLRQFSNYRRMTREMLYLISRTDCFGSDSDAPRALLESVRGSITPHLFDNADNRRRFHRVIVLFCSGTSIAVPEFKESTDWYQFLPHKSGDGGGTEKYVFDGLSYSLELGFSHPVLSRYLMCAMTKLTVAERSVINACVGLDVHVRYDMHLSKSFDHAMNDIGILDSFAFDADGLLFELIQCDELDSDELESGALLRVEEDGKLLRLEDNVASDCREEDCKMGFGRDGLESDALVCAEDNSELVGAGEGNEFVAVEDSAGSALAHDDFESGAAVAAADDGELVCVEEDCASTHALSERSEMMVITCRCGMVQRSDRKDCLNCGIDFVRQSKKKVKLVSARNLLPSSIDFCDKVFGLMQGNGKNVEITYDDSRDLFDVVDSDGNTSTHTESEITSLERQGKLCYTSYLNYGDGWHKSVSPDDTRYLSDNPKYEEAIKEARLRQEEGGKESCKTERPLSVKKMIDKKNRSIVELAQQLQELRTVDDLTNNAYMVLNFPICVQPGKEGCNTAVDYQDECDMKDNIVKRVAVQRNYLQNYTLMHGRVTRHYGMCRKGIEHLDGLANYDTEILANTCDHKYDRKRQYMPIVNNGYGRYKFGGRLVSDITEEVFDDGIELLPKFLAGGVLRDERGTLTFNTGNTGTEATVLRRHPIYGRIPGLLSAGARLDDDCKKFIARLLILDTHVFASSIEAAENVKYLILPIRCGIGSYLRLRCLLELPPRTYTR